MRIIMLGDVVGEPGLRALTGADGGFLNSLWGVGYDKIS
jgi:calcineurin-like phosphoesterase